MTLIAMIDDEPLVRDSVGKLLQVRGYEICYFDSAEGFLESPQLETADCMVVDHRLPGMTGCDLLRQLRSQSEMIPALLFSGNVDETTRAMLDGLQNVTMLGKPCLSAELYAAVETCLANG